VPLAKVTVREGRLPQQAVEERPLPPLIPPPRSVPVSLRLVVLFGGGLSQFGWLFFGFGMIFVWVFGSFADFTPLTFYKGPWRLAEGVITSGRDLHMKVNSASVYAHSFTFATPDGVRHEGRCRGTGGLQAPGTPVTIQYREWDPSVARLRGAGGGGLPFVPLLFVAIFPAVGLGFIIPALRRGLKANRLLAGGVLDHGALKSVRPTGTRINNRAILELIFEFEVGGRTYTASAQTDEPAPLQDERREPLLYDPVDPTHAVMLDGLPGRPTIDPSGQFEGAGVGRLLGAALLPLLVIGVHGTVACLLLLR
jgi:hypothetical protein